MAGGKWLTCDNSHNPSAFFVATWPSGKAEVCKTFIMGSNPIVAFDNSKLKSTSDDFILLGQWYGGILMLTTTLPKYISISEATERIGVPEAVLHDWIQTGKMDAAQLPDGKIAVMENTMNEIPKYITISEAAQRIGTTKAKLNKWLSDDANKYQVDAVQLSDGKIVVAESVISKLRPLLGKKENLALYQSFDHFEDNPISMSAAARKYSISQPTISRWTKRGYIKRLNKTGREVLINEQDVAYCVAVYEEQNGGRGRQVFTANGIPRAKYRRASLVAA